MANILGIKISELKPKETLEKAESFLSDGRQHYLVTPNPEIILAAHKDEEFFYILNQSDLSLADGFGLVVAGWLFGDRIWRTTGSQLSFQLLRLANERGTKVLVLNRTDGLSRKGEIETALKENYPRLPFLVLDVDRGQKFLDPGTIAAINEAKPEIMFSALGFPYQEKVIYHNLEKLPSVKLAIGIGGTFDYLTGQVKRPPQAFRSLGLEWFWRLLHIFRYEDGARRLGRIYNATFVFMGKLLKARFLNPLRYRPNVACLLYKEEGGRKMILLAEREDEPGHWQLPQGGTDGESLEEAGARELREEIGNDKFVTKATFKNLHRYIFHNKEGKAEYRGLKKRDAVFCEHKKHRYDYKGQKQGLYIAKFTGGDQDIKICFWDHVAWKWVEADRLVEAVHPVRRIGAKVFLEKFKSLNL